MENEMKISPGHYDVNGRKQGIWIEYTTDDNGNKFMERGSYDEGVRYGQWKRYNLTKRGAREIKKNNTKK